MIYIALPVLNESMEIPHLLKALKNQQEKKLLLVVCVNQYDYWWNDENYRLQCEDNQRSIQLLNYEKEILIKIIDRSSAGKGWPKKKSGVGWARKVIMDWISGKANKEDVIVSVDADTYYPPEYLHVLDNFFRQNKTSWALSIPYYHRLTGNIENDKLILRYEIYMRCFLLNMIRIENPYAFTALGSAMAFPVWAYQKAGGLTPVASGEDFYFLQKLVKYGTVNLFVPTTAYPSSRLSSRVTFGTGPALIRGKSGDWSAYPIYSPHFFDDVGSTFQLFSGLFDHNMSTPMDNFLARQFNPTAFWELFRRNYKDRKNFIKACQNKVDGLRILQYLRFRQARENITNELALTACLRKENLAKEDQKCINEIMRKGLLSVSVDCLQAIRNSLFNAEIERRKWISGKEG